MERVVPARVEDLLVHAGLVRSVARAVLHGDDRVEDVVQDTWVASIEGGPRDPAKGPGWLSRVAKRLAWTVRRRDATRTRRETAAARLDALPSTAEIASREEARRRVVEALLLIEEPFRSALLLRYYEGLAPREIASRLGVPVETARSRVRRGLERLRARLLEGRDAERERRHLAMLTRLPTSLAGTFLLGGLFVTQKSIVAAAALLLLLLGAGGWFVWTREEEPEPAGLAGREATLEPAAVPTLATAPKSAAGSGAPDASGGGVVPTAALESRAILRGRLLSFDPSLAGRAAVLVTGIFDWPHPPRDPIAAVAREDGSFEIDVGALTAAPSAKELRVLVDHPAYVRAVSRVRLEAVDPLRIGVVMTRAGAVVGRVLTAAGAPVSGAVVGLLALRDGGLSLDAVRSDSDGTFRLRAARDGTYRIVADADGLRPAWSAETLSVRSDRQVRPLILVAGAEISGTAVAPVLPEASLEIEAWPEWLGSSITLQAIDGGTIASLTTDGERLEKWDIRVRVEPNGVFRIGGLVPGPHRLRGAVADGARGVAGANVHQDLREALEVRVDAPAKGVSLLLSGAFLVVDLATRDGPIPKGGVEVSGVVEGEEEHSGTYGMSTDEKGRARLLVRPGRLYRIGAHAEGLTQVERTVRAPAVGAELVERIVLESSKPPSRVLVLKLTTESGENPGVSKIELRMLPLTGDDDTNRWAVPREDGRFRAANPPAGRHRLRVQSAGIMVDGTVPYLEAEQVVDVAEHGESETTVRLALGGWLLLSAKASEGRLLPARCRVLDATGASRARFFMVRDEGGAHGHSGALDADAPAQVEPPLPAGTYTVELEADGFAAKRADAVVKRGETTVLEVTLEPK